MPEGLPARIKDVARAVFPTGARLPPARREEILVEELVEYGRALGLSREKARAVIATVNSGPNAEQEARDALIEASFTDGQVSDDGR